MAKPWTVPGCCVLPHAEMHSALYFLLHSVTRNSKSAFQLTQYPGWYLSWGARGTH